MDYGVNSGTRAEEENKRLRGKNGADIVEGEN